MDTLQPVRPADIPKVHARLVEAIDSSPYYSDRFKAYEKRRFDRLFLRTLIAVDPWHIALAWRDGEIAGLTLTIPEHGTLWAPWIYVTPKFQSKALGLTMLRTLLRHWDNGRFHKVAFYTRPDNTAASTVFRRLGFAEIVVLKQHIFGEDYVLFERPFNKVTEGYDNGVQVSRGQRLRLKLATLLGR